MAFALLQGKSLLKADNYILNQSKKSSRRGQFLCRDGKWTSEHSTQTSGRITPLILQEERSASLPQYVEMLCLKKCFNKRSYEVLYTEMYSLQHVPSYKMVTSYRSSLELKLCEAFLPSAFQAQAFASGKKSLDKNSVELLSVES